MPTNDLIDSRVRPHRSLVAARGLGAALASLCLAFAGGCGDNDQPSAPDAAPAPADAAAPDAAAPDAAASDAGVLGPHLLVASSRDDQVLRFDQDSGAFIDVFIPAGSGGLDDPDTLVVRGDYLYVAGGTTLEDSGIYRYELASGSFVDVFASGGGLLRPYGFAFGPDDRLYVSSFRSDQILRYDATTGAFIDVFASGDGEAGGVNGPNGMVFDAEGRLYLSTQGSVAVDGEVSYPGLPSEVLRFDIGDGSSEVFAEQPTPMDSSAGYVSLLGLSFGPDCEGGACDLFVSDFANGIRRYDSDGALIGSIDTSYTGTPSSNLTGSISFGDDGSLFAVGFADSGANEGVILRWDGATGEPRPAAELSGALLVEDSEPELIRPIGILAISP
ncbi:PEP-CTERM sorting domain-containing protein [Haliangium ochraceum]|nr:PEP-CTERM sorting domain-containing protein [Haliangium ochraceum]